ncbi:MAG: purine-nucleoside phosphorylase [Bacilli bacterium]
MPTPHIKAEKGDFARTVLMPGDPNRAKWIAENFLHDYKLVNSVRGILGYTGYTKDNKLISVMASGMGIPSIGIYSHELFTKFDVEQIIRIGTCGADSPDLNVFDIIIGNGASTDSAYASTLGCIGTLSAVADYELVEKAVVAARELQHKVHVGQLFSSDIFYDDSNNFGNFSKLGVLGCEMEAYGLYVEAMRCHKKALAMCTVSDHFTKPQNLTSDEREQGLKNMIEIACKLA